MPSEQIRNLFSAPTQGNAFQNNSPLMPFLMAMLSAQQQQSTAREEETRLLEKGFIRKEEQAPQPQQGGILGSLDKLFKAPRTDPGQFKPGPIHPGELATAGLKSRESEGKLTREAQRQRRQDLAGIYERQYDVAHDRAKEMAEIAFEHSVGKIALQTEAQLSIQDDEQEFRENLEGIRFENDQAKIMLTGYAGQLRDHAKAMLEGGALSIGEQQSALTFATEQAGIVKQRIIDTYLEGVTVLQPLEGFRAGAIEALQKTGADVPTWMLPPEVQQQLEAIDQMAQEHFEMAIDASSQEFKSGTGPRKEQSIRADTDKILNRKEAPVPAPKPNLTGSDKTNQPKEREKTSREKTAERLKPGN